MLPLLLLTLCAAGCAREDEDLMRGEKREPLNDSLYGVLDEETRDFFQGFSENSAEYMLILYDQHYPVAVVRDKELILSVEKTLSDVRVTAKTNVSTTDAYHALSFVTAEGKAYTIGFENVNLHENGQNYVIGDADAFWKLFRSSAEDYWERAEETAAKYEAAPVCCEPDTLAKRIGCEIASSDFGEPNDSHWIDVSVTLRFLNKSDAPITGVAFMVQFLDYDGYVMCEATETADFTDAPLKAGAASGEYVISGRTYDFSSVLSAAPSGVAGALVTITAAEPSEEQREEPREETVEPPEISLFEFYNDSDITAFAKNYYNDPPQTLTVILNWYSPRSIAVADKETATEVFEALKKVSVGEEAKEIITDYDTHFRFTYDDGREYTFGFNGGSLMIRTDKHPYQKCYAISGGGDLGALIKMFSEQ